MKVLGINGLESDGSGTVDILGNALVCVGHTYIDANYRKTRLFRFQTYDRGRQFEDAHIIGRDYYTTNRCDALNSIIIAHSRGCLVAWRMLELGYRFRAVFLFRPAMNRNFILPVGQDNVYCINRADDRLLALGSWLPFNDFGNAGRYGFDDDRVINISASQYSHTEFWRHSDDFLNPQVNGWATLIDTKLKAA